MNVRKVALVAQRDFIATVSNRGFVIGLLLMPVIIAIAAIAGPRIIASRAPLVRGDVAIIDPTGQVAGRLREVISPDAIRRRRDEAVRRVIANAPAGTQSAAAGAADATLGQVPELRLVERTQSDLQAEKDRLARPSDADSNALALVVVHPDAVSRPAGGTFGAYELFIASRLTGATETVVADSVRESIVAARLGASDLDRRTVEETMRVERPASVIVSASGEQQSRRGFTGSLPLILGVLLFVAIMMGGQSLMTSTIEEKSSRVIEVLLAAVSPIELMAGKLLGQMGVGLLTMALYLGVGVFALFQFALMGLVDPMLVVYLLLFFLLSYLVFGALMMAVGASVNQMAEAQSLMAPIFITLMGAYILTPMIGRAPNSTFSVAASFIPPFNTFAMMARVASDAPPPVWQVGLTMVIGIAAAAGAVWFAAKVFKVGLLMHGKPPNFATLVRWARQA